MRPCLLMRHCTAVRSRGLYACTPTQFNGTGTIKLRGREVGDMTPKPHQSH